MIILPVVIRMYLITSWKVLAVFYLFFFLGRTKTGFMVKLKEFTC